MGTQNYENLREHNVKSYPQLSKTMDRMHKVIPIGGFNNSGNFHFGMNMKQWENLLNNILGWFLTLVPVLCLFWAATSRKLLSQFTCCYCLFTLFCLSVLMAIVDFRNRQVFLDCKFCVPVPVNSENLKGLRNYFKDLTEDNLRSLKAVKKPDRDFLIKLLQNRSNVSEESQLLKAETESLTSISSKKTIRVMFYSVEYYQKFVQVPRYKLYGVCFLNAVFMIICIILSIRKIEFIH